MVDLVAILLQPRRLVLIITSQAVPVAALKVCLVIGEGPVIRPVELGELAELQVLVDEAAS